MKIQKSRIEIQTQTKKNFVQTCYNLGPISFFWFSFGQIILKARIKTLTQTEKPQICSNMF